MAFTNVLFDPDVADAQERKGILARKARQADKAFFDMGSTPAPSAGVPSANSQPMRGEIGMAGPSSNPEANLMNFGGDQSRPQQFPNGEPKKKGGFGEGLMKVLPLILGAISGGLMMGPAGIPMGLMYGMAGKKKMELADRELDINDQYKTGTLANQIASDAETRSWHDEQLKRDDRKLAETIANNKESNRIANLRATKTNPLDELMAQILKEKRAASSGQTAENLPIIQKGNENARVPGPNDRVVVLN